MTGKELVFVLGGAAVLGAGAGTAAALLRGGDPVPGAPAAGVDVAILERLEHVEKALAEARAAVDEARAAARAAETRAADAIAAADRARDAAAAARAEVDGVAGETGTAVRADEAVAKAAEALRDGRVRRMVLDGLHGAGEGEAGRAAAVITLDRLSAEMKGLGAGLRLRSKPEAERWAAAKEDLGLSDAQVADLQAAIAERDRAIEDAMVTEKRTIGQGDREITVKRLDAERAAQVQRDHRDRVHRSLTPEQQKGWSEKGYDHAFGNPHAAGLGGGRPMAVMAIESTLSTWEGSAAEGQGK